MKQVLPTVFLSQLALKKMQAYTQSVSSEISGLGTVEVKENIFIVDDIFLLAQECNIGLTTMSEEGIASFLTDRIQANLPIGNIRLWWHSHFTGETYWSPIDDKTIKDTFPQASWFLSIVCNQQGDLLARFDLFKPVRITVDELPVYFYTQNDDEFIDKIHREVSEKVVVEKTIITRRYSNGYQPFAATRYLAPK